MYAMYGVDVGFVCFGLGVGWAGWQRHLREVYGIERGLLGWV